MILAVFASQPKCQKIKTRLFLLKIMPKSHIFRMTQNRKNQLDTLNQCSMSKCFASAPIAKRTPGIVSDWGGICFENTLLLPSKIAL
jgi:hypothetical protein